MFKVGDKVMVVAKDSFLIGKIGTVQSVDKDFDYPYDVDCCGCSANFSGSEIILMEAASD